MERIQLYQLHAPDARVPLATSVRALDTLRKEGLIERVGLCDVSVGQIEEARRITEIASVQVELSLWHDTNVLNGVVTYCIAHGIQLIAYRPLGGSRQSGRLLSQRVVSGFSRTSPNPVLADIAARHGATSHEIALAWLQDLSETIVTIPGPTRLETMRSVIRAHDIQLTADDRDGLEAQFPSPRSWCRVDPALSTRSCAMSLRGNWTAGSGLCASPGLSVPLGG